MSLFFRVIEHLLPRAAAWRLAADRDLKKFLEAHAETAQIARDAIDQIWAESLAAETTNLDDWEEEFGLSKAPTEAARRAAIATAKAGLGGQSPHYIQELIHTAGFTDIFLHEWWEPGSEPLVIRDPHDYLNEPGIGTVQAGEPDAEAGEPTAEANDFAAGPFNYFSSLTVPGRAPPPLPTDDYDYTGFVYFGAETFPETLKYPPERKAEFERLVRKFVPGHLWIGELVFFTDDVTAPSFVSATVTEDGKTITVLMDESLADNFTDFGAFTLYAEEAAIDGMLVAGSAVLLSLDPPLLQTDLTAALAYTKPGAGGLNVLRDGVDNQTDSFGPETVDVTQVDPTKAWPLLVNFDAEVDVTASGFGVETWVDQFSGVVANRNGNYSSYAADDAEFENQGTITMPNGAAVQIDVADLDLAAQKFLHDGTASWELHFFGKADVSAHIARTGVSVNVTNGITITVSALGRLSANIIAASAAIATAESADGEVTGNPQWIRVRFDHVAAELGISIDGGAWVTSAVSGTHSSSNPDGSLVFGRVVFSSGDLTAAHFLLFTEVLNDHVSNSVASYLLGKYLPEWPAGVFAAYSADDVVTSGSDVTQLNDVTGAGEHITNTGGNYPSLNTTAFSAPVIRADRTLSQRLVLPAAWCSHANTEDAPIAAIASCFTIDDGIGRVLMSTGVAFNDFGFRITTSPFNDRLNFDKSDGLTSAFLSPAVYPGDEWITFGLFGADAGGGGGVDYEWTVGASHIAVASGNLNKGAHTATAVGYLFARYDLANFWEGYLSRLVLCTDTLTGLSRLKMLLWAHARTPQLIP